MLTVQRLAGSTVGVLLVVAAVLAGAPSAEASSPPGAAPPGCTWAKSGTGWVLDCSTPGGGGEDPTGGGGGGGGEPSCDLTAPYNEFCEGTSACWGNNPAAVEDPQDLKGVEKPSEDSHAAYKSCRRADGSTYDEWYWTEDDEGPTLAERAQQALASLVLPAITPTFNPPGATLVNLDTWWWAEGATTGPVRSPAALGVVAIAAPSRMEVDPGDGSSVLRCAVVTQRSDTCAHRYLKASSRAVGRTAEGRPAYPARMRIVYELTFEFDGTVIEIDGVDPTISSEWVARPVEVREVQTLVKPGR